jgi:DNA polymerase-3 subunit epsilon
MNRFVAIDVEIASRTPVHICAIGVVRIDGGQETASLQSHVRTKGPIRFTRIHGLRAADLRDAPEWPAVWANVLPLLAGIDVVVAYHAEFDRGAVLSNCARHGIRLPRLRFVCAAELAERRLGRRLDLESSMAALGLVFPGRPHDPLSDARAAAAITLACMTAAGDDATV